MRRVLIGLGVLVSGCGDGELLLPALPTSAEAATEVLVYGQSGRSPDAHFVIDLRAGAAPLRFDLPDEPRRFEAFIIDIDVETLGVTPGPGTLPEQGAPLPASAYDAFTSAYEPGGSLSWAPEAAPQWTNLLRFPGLTARGCLVDGGCFVDDVCQRPCAAVVAPAEAASPQAPRFVCPTGWRATTLAFQGGDAPERSVDVCEPWPDGEPVCADDEMRRPGIGCTPLADPCPSDAFGPLGPGANVYVAAGAVGGDGTRERPYGTLAAGLATVPRGGRVHLGAGAYTMTDDPVTAPMELVGRCPSDVTVRGVLDVRTATVVVASVRWVGAVQVGAGAATVRGVRVDADRAGPAVAVTSGRLSFDGLRINGGAGPALAVAGGATVQGVGLDASASAQPALDIAGGSSLEVADWSAWREEDVARTAVRVTDSSLVAQRGVSQGEVEVEAEADADLTDLVVRAAASGLSIEGSDLTARRLWVDTVPVRALTTSGEGRVEVIDSVLSARDTVTDGTLVGISTPNTRFERSVWFGGMNNGANVGADTTLVDVSIHGMAISGLQINVTGCDLSRVRVEDVGELGIYLRRADCRVSDLRLSSIGENRCALVSGVFASRSETIMNRVAATAIRGTAIRVVDGTWTGADVAIVDPFAPDCGPGVGIGVELDAAVADLRRFSIRGASHAGLRVFSTNGVDPTFSASEGEVTSGKIGLELGLVDFPLDRLLDRVDFSGNEDPLVDFSF